MEAARHLHVVNPETGEITECPGCIERDDQITGLERVIRSQASTIAKLQRDRAKDARESDWWDEAEQVFDYWRKTCQHPRSSFDVDRFELVLPYLRKDGAELCRRAIDGAAFDPYVTVRKNGSKQRHDGFELVFRSRGKFEEFCNRAPRKAA